MEKLSKAILVATALWSTGGWAAGWHPAGPPGPPPHDPEQRLAQLTERLQLDSYQAEEAAAILARVRQESIAERASLQHLHGELEAQQEEFDEGTARELARQIGELTGRMLYRSTAARAAIFQLLDEHQQAEYRALQQQLEARRFQMRERMPEQRE